MYKFRDRDGRVIYVGKAKSLRARLNNYFQPPHTLHPRTRSADATPTEVSRVETPQVGSAKLEPVKAEPAKVESAPELRRSTD